VGILTTYTIPPYAIQWGVLTTWGAMPCTCVAIRRILPTPTNGNANSGVLSRIQTTVDTRLWGLVRPGHVPTSKIILEKFRRARIQVYMGQKV
jgi:hypothetical protein